MKQRGQCRSDRKTVSKKCYSGVGSALLVLYTLEKENNEREETRLQDAMPSTVRKYERWREKKAEWSWLVVCCYCGVLKNGPADGCLVQTADRRTRRTVMVITSRGRTAVLCKGTNTVLYFFLFFVYIIATATNF